MSVKRCRDCGQTKPVGEFWKRKASEDGLALYCKDCFSLRNHAAESRRRVKNGKEPRPYQRRRVVPEGMKFCPRCQQVKALAEFGRNRAEKSGLAAYCKPCHNTAMGEIRERNHGSSRNYLLKLRYGLTAEQVEEHRRSQGGICVICLRREASHVDHDHETGLFRGLLCFPCNGALGQYEDDSWRMRESADYLEGRSSHSRAMLIEFGVLWLGGRARRLVGPHGVRITRSRSPRDVRLLYRYGVGEDEIEALRRVQRGRCPICCDGPAENVDHDHETGVIRGILCGGCNTGMGQLGDDPVALRRAADYVEGKLIKRLPRGDGGVRLSFTRPDVDPGKIPLDGWGPFRDGGHRKGVLEPTPERVRELLHFPWFGWFDDDDEVLHHQGA